jgi:hypothetical protein
MSEQPKTLGVSVGDDIKTSEAFGNQNAPLRGVAGTLHLTDEGKKDSIMNTAIMLSKSTSLPVVIVVRL